MKFPNQRITVTVAEYLLIKPGLDTLANGFANARLGAFPRRHPFHLIDTVASAIYEDRAYDAESEGCIMTVRRKLWGMTQSRKVRLNPFEIAAAAFAARIVSDHQTSRTEIANSPEMKLFRDKLELYRRRAVRASINRDGPNLYQTAADAWLKFVLWCRYNALYFKMPEPVRFRRAAMWREQRLQLSGIISTLLQKRFCENLDENQMTRTVTLALSSLRRSRKPVGLRDLLRNPEPHEDLLFEFISKRNDLVKLPGAPLPAWQEITNRTDRFKTYAAAKQARTAQRAVSTAPDATVPVATVSVQAGLSPRRASIRPLETSVAPVETVAAPSGNTHNGLALTAETLCDAMAEWLAIDVGSRFNLVREICEQAQHMISKNLLDQYRVSTVSTSFEGLLLELRPTSPATDLPDVISDHAGWLLSVLLALRQVPNWMYHVIGVACARALQLAPPTHHSLRIG